MDPSRLTSLSLVDGLLKQDEAYWRRLNTLYGPIVDFWIQKAEIPKVAEEDIKQEVFMAVSKNISQYKHSTTRTGSLRAWIWGIARNKIIDFRREQEKNAAAQGGTHALGRLKELPNDPFEDSDAGTTNRIRKELVTRALQILKSDFEEKTWQAFWLVTVEERPAADVAESLAMSPQAVRQAKYRVLQRLREELGEEFPQ
jgi:RNA polymerase sigma-70 factor (ECF subfamily)